MFLKREEGRKKERKKKTQQKAERLNTTRLYLLAYKICERQQVNWLNEQACGDTVYHTEKYLMGSRSRRLHETIKCAAGCFP